MLQKLMEDRIIATTDCKERLSILIATDSPSDLMPVILFVEDTGIFAVRKVHYSIC
ncbi:hypothetical protein C2W64_02099 [Brevibacillus laterosporus]|nr:hypothetical protein [Brevibacillus laterosporus]RAP26083.1 hypothetical protein C2W64_02099 [Brevibacillus laterosporus]